MSLSPLPLVMLSGTAFDSPPLFAKRAHFLPSHLSLPPLCWRSSCGTLMTTGQVARVGYLPIAEGSTLGRLFSVGTQCRTLPTCCPLIALLCPVLQVLLQCPGDQRPSGGGVQRGRHGGQYHDLFPVCGYLRYGRFSVLCGEPGHLPGGGNTRGPRPSGAEFHTREDEGARGRGAEWGRAGTREESGRGAGDGIGREVMEEVIEEPPRDGTPRAGEQTVHGG